MTDISGRIATVNASHNLIRVGTDVLLPDPDWNQTVSMAPWNVTDLVSTGALNRMEFSGRIQVTTATSCNYYEVFDETTTATYCTVTITAETDLSLEGIYFFLYLPAMDFTSGVCRLQAADGSETSAPFPAVTPPDPHFLQADAVKAVFTNSSGATSITLDFSQTYNILLQDERTWGSDRYAVFTSFGPGDLLAGESYAISYALSAEMSPDMSAANLTMNPAVRRYRLEGIGGNYCFDKQSPVTSYTLNTLNSGWARVETSLAAWEPTNAHITSDTDWAAMAVNDTAGSDLHAEFLLAKEIQRRGIPYMASAWHLPEWAYTDPGQPSYTYNRVIAPEQWDDILRCIGSYLLYARQQYGVEPDFFSFNEPNAGVFTLFTPEEHRDAIKRVGAHLQQLGLKTRMVLGDTGSPDSIAFTQAAVADPDAMRFVGAVSMHSWGGGTPAQYSAWGDLASSLGLPLLIGEVGTNADAWRSPAVLGNGIYALQEIQMYQELLLYARPQGMMQWEFTDDYSLVNVSEGPSGTQLAPTRRFWFIKQFCNLTPHGCEALATTSDKAPVMMTAFRKSAGLRTQFVMHILNLGPARAAVISGAPSGLKFRAIRTGEGEDYQELAPVTSAADGIHLTLAPQSLLTLISESPISAKAWTAY
ncbi:MAG: hypothetical protein NTX50_03370 [Candidatus Sumerlaeota bacterium]|nr:hypothetical protein [Candidatus Sumerlaeota bacterium]